jgi:hypothetical protein
MTKTQRQEGGADRRRSPRPERKISVRAVRRDPADYRKLARALVAIAEAEAAAQQHTETTMIPKEVA